MSKLAIVCVTAVSLLLAGVDADASIDGITGTTFTLSAKADRVSTPDGGSFLLWGYANGGGRAQYPGPTLILNQGDIIAITLNNELSVPVFIVFPGQEGVLASPSTAPDGLLTKEAVPGGRVTYQFTATNAGTYLYQSGTASDLQVEMGLFGAIVVRPYAGARYAYNHPDSQFDRDHLFLLSEMDPRIHDLGESGGTVKDNQIGRLLRDLWLDLQEPNVLWQIALGVGCVLAAWWLAGHLRWRAPEGSSRELNTARRRSAAC